jgi:hypothetical protein
MIVKMPANTRTAAAMTVLSTAIIQGDPEKYVEVWVHPWVKPACLSIYMHRPSLATKPPPHLRSPTLCVDVEKGEGCVSGGGWLLICARRQDLRLLWLLLGLLLLSLLLSLLLLDLLLLGLRFLGRHVDVCFWYVRAAVSVSMMFSH